MTFKTLNQYLEPSVDMTMSYLAPTKLDIIHNSINEAGSPSKLSKTS